MTISTLVRIAGPLAALALSACVIPLPSDYRPPHFYSLEPLPPRPASPQDPAPLAASPNDPPQSATVSCFTPGQDCAAVIADAIAGSRTTIRVQAYSFTDPDIAAALIAAYRRGVDVRVIIDRQHAFEKGGMMPALAQAGIPVSVDPIAGLAHSKVMIIDDRIVITGSYNFTESAAHRNAENLLVVSDATLAARYAENWRERDAASR
jgi:phosphatidylserine/phosphatidylglycerophosphate/cardiolipin synthase-like enzyme